MNLRPLVRRGKGPHDRRPRDPSARWPRRGRRPASGPSHRRRVARAAVLAAIASLVAPGFTAAAQAHHGYAGPVRLYLDAVTVEPGANGWLIRAALHDSGNGRPAPGFVVHATGTGPAGAALGPATLADPDADGRYEAPLGQIPTGDWSLTLDVTDAPGASERAIPLKRTWPVTLQAGQTLDVLGRLPSPSSGDSSDSGPPVPLILGIAAGLTGLAVAARQITRRRTHPVAPAR